MTRFARLLAPLLFPAALLAQTPAPLEVGWTVTAGTITSGGRFTAPTAATNTTANACTISVCGSMAVAVQPAPVRPPDPPSISGQLFGPWDWLSYDPPADTLPFTAAHQSSNTPSQLLSNIARARQRGESFVAALPCGPHNQAPDRRGFCLRDSLGIAVFSWIGFDTALAKFNTPQIREAVTQAYQDGVLIHINLIDEPWVHAKDDGSGSWTGNTWGSRGLSKVQVDSICAKAKRVFPLVTVGTSDYWGWEPTKPIRVCDAMTEQFVFNYTTLPQFKTMKAWRDSSLARARRDGYGRIFSFNPMNGGFQDRTDGTWDCSSQSGGRKGQNSPLCRMPPAQVYGSVDTLGVAGCSVLLAWRWDETDFDAADYQREWSRAAALERSRPKVLCKRR